MQMPAHLKSFYFLMFVKIKLAPKVAQTYLLYLTACFFWHHKHQRTLACFQIKVNQIMRRSSYIYHFGIGAQAKQTKNKQANHALIQLLR